MLEEEGVKPSEKFWIGTISGFAELLLAAKLPLLDVYATVMESVLRLAVYDMGYVTVQLTEYGNAAPAGIVTVGQFVPAKGSAEASAKVTVPEGTMPPVGIAELVLTVATYVTV